MSLLLLLACLPDPPPAGDTQPWTLPDDTAGTTDTDTATGPGSYTDPLQRGAELSLVASGPS